MSSNSNIFQDVLGDAKAVEEKLLGPDYPYYKYVRTPKEIGMSDKGSLNALGKDIDGLVAYVELLVSGKSKASATGKPLGNSFFLQTGAKCKDIKTNEEVPRFIYIDNIPRGNIPLISSGMGVNFSEFKGLIPGTISNLNALNPFKILQAFGAGSVPDCQELTMNTIDIYNNKSSETHHVALVDIKSIDPCSFPDKKNILTGQKCKETFNNYNINDENFISIIPKIPDDILAQLYFSSLGLLGIYILYKLSQKIKL